MTNRELALEGLSPYDTSGQKIVLHHIDQTPNGPLAELPDNFHRQNYSQIHNNTGQNPSLINRSEFNKLRSDYWKWRAEQSN